MPGAPQASVPVTLTLRIPDGRRQFRPGEIIPIELEFESSVPKRFVVDGATYDRSGRLTVDELHIEPLDSVIDPMLDYFAANSGYIGGGIRSKGVLGESPFTVRLELNEWFRFDRPGLYTFSVRSHRVTDNLQGSSTIPRVVPVESNRVSFEILERDRDWEAAELAAALSILNGPSSDSDPRKGCRMLQALATDAAVDQMIRRLDDSQQGCEFEFMTGLFGAPTRDRVVHQLEAGLRAPDVPVGPHYLRTLAILSIYASHPELRAPQTRDNKARIIAGELSRRPDLIQAAHDRYAAILADVVLHKTGRARGADLGRPTRICLEQRVRGRRARSVP